MMKWTTTVVVNYYFRVSYVPLLPYDVRFGLELLGLE